MLISAAEIFFVLFVSSTASRQNILESLASLLSDEDDVAEEVVVHTPEIELSTSPDMSKLNFRSIEPRKTAVRKRLRSSF